jgi:hypothetical protein
MCPERSEKRPTEHDTLTIDEAGFKELENGALLESAAGDFDVIITVDKNIEYQQNKLTPPIAVLILSAKSNRYESPLPLIPRALRIINHNSEIIKRY